MKKPLPFFSMLVLGTCFLIPQDLLAKKRPDWVEGGSKKYPSPQYFIGVGSSSTKRGVKSQQEKMAENNARAEIAKIFRVQVESQTQEKVQVQIQSQMLKKKAGKGLFESASFTDAISTSTAMALEGVEVVERWTDKKDRTIYALAVLDRNKAMNLVSQNLEKEKGALGVAVSAASLAVDGGNLFFAMKQLNLAAGHALQVDVLAAQQAILSPSGYTGKEGGESQVAVIQNRLNELCHAIRFQVEVTGVIPEAKRHLLAALTREGFRSRTDPVEAKSPIPSHSYALIGQTALIDRGPIQVGGYQAQVAQAQLDLTVKDLGTGEVVGQINWATNGNDRQLEAARLDAIRQLGKAIEDQLLQKLMAASP